MTIFMFLVEQSRWASYNPFPCIFIQSCIKIQYNISTSSHDEVTNEFAKLQKLKGYLSSSEKDFLAIMKIMCIFCHGKWIRETCFHMFNRARHPRILSKINIALVRIISLKRTTFHAVWSPLFWNCNESLHFHNLLLFGNHITAVLIQIFN